MRSHAEREDATTLPSPVAERLARLAPDQRAAATAPPGPVLCVAPAGSGKTTTLVARAAWLIATGSDPGRVCAITFNRRAAEELSSRIAPAVEPLGVAADGVRVRTFHALGREILADAGVAVDALVDREALLASLFPGLPIPDRRRLDTALSRLKLDLAVTAEEVASLPSPGPLARAFLAYEAELAATGSLDFDDLVARALRVLEGDAALLTRWRARCADLLVDEAQDVDRSQLRLALLLAAPDDRIFLVGDDDQSIYGWRLADVRRVLGLAEVLPGLRRVDLVTNYRCPRPVVERAVRLIEGNRERFAKRIVAGPAAVGRLVLAPDPADDAVRVARILDSWPPDGSSRAILARTNRELLPAVAVALERALPFRAPATLELVLDSPHLDAVLSRAGSSPGIDGVGAGPGGALRPQVAPAENLVRLEWLRRTMAAEEAAEAEAGTVEEETARTPPAEEGEVVPTLRASEVAAALLAWAPAYPDIAALAAAVIERRRRLAECRREDAQLTLATAHSTKGLEFDHVAVIDLDTGRFPSARSVREAIEPERALEEERRLAYVAWTRARRSLTLVFDPGAPSPFLLEAFDADELGIEATVAEAASMGP